MVCLAGDVDSAGVVGRVREPIQLPAFSALVPAVSSLGLALSTYAEVYGLSRDSDGRARYQARYTFQPSRSVLARLLGGVTPVVFEFAREAEWRGTVPERLVIQPGRLPPGRYRVTLAVTDLPSNVKSETVALDITIR